MRLTLTSLLCLLLAPWAMAQDFYNDWIAGTSYLKIEVQQDGLYRIYGKTLRENNYGIAQASEIRMFHRGKEVAFALYDFNNDDFIGDEEYIEFYGRKADGLLDTRFFEQGQAFHLNPKESMYSDKSVYFLSLDLVNKGKRVPTRTLSPDISAPQLSYAWSDSLYSAKSNFYVRDSRGRYQASLAKGRPYLFDHLVYPSTFRIGARGFVDYWYHRKTAADKEFSQARNDYAFRLDRYDATAQQPVSLTISLASVSASYTQVAVQVGASEQSLREVSIVSLDAYAGERLSLPLLPSDIGAQGEVLVRFRDLSEGLDPALPYNQFGVSSIEWQYPQRLGQQSPARSERIRLQTSGNIRLQAGERLWDVTDPWNAVQLELPAEGGWIQASEAQPRTLLLVREPVLLQTPAVLRPTEALLLPKQGMEYDFLIVTTAPLYEAAQAYARYRESPEGGSHKVLVAHIEQVYNTFSYGEYSPWAVRDLCRYMLQYAKAKHLFLVGRGIDVDNFYGARSLTDAQAVYNNRYHPAYVPPYGMQGSDIAYVMGLGGKPSDVPAMSVGRLPAASAAMVQDYLKKVTLYENTYIPEQMKDWRKRAAHLSGGNTVNERREFAALIEPLKEVFESPLQGGKVVKVFNKTNDGFVDVSANLKQDILSGLGFITFVGHASYDAPDFDIGNPAKLNNSGRLPMITALGCGSGDVFIPGGYSWASRWLNVQLNPGQYSATQGASLVLAKTEYSVLNFGMDYLNAFYRTAFLEGTGESFYGRPVGEIVQETSRRLLAHRLDKTSNNYLGTLAHCEQYVLQGDPSMAISLPKPDYVVNPNIHGKPISVKGDQEGVISPNTGKLYFEVPLANFGKADTVNLKLEVVRTFPSGKRKKYPLIPVRWEQAPFTETTVAFSIDNTEEDKLQSAGMNEFAIIADPENLIDEMDEGRTNEAIVRLQLVDPRVKIVYPYDFSIVGSDTLSMHVLDYNEDRQERTYKLQLSRTPDFSVLLPAGRGEQTIKAAGLASFKVQLDATDSVVYYARCFSDQFPGVWHDMSFTYLKGKSGWMQSQKAQFKKNQLDGLWINDRNVWHGDSLRLQLRTHGQLHPGGFQVVKDGRTLLRVAYVNVSTYEMADGDVGIPEHPAFVETNANGRRFFKLGGGGILLMTMDRLTGQPYVMRDASGCYQLGEGNPPSVTLYTNGQLDNFSRYFEGSGKTLKQAGDYVHIMSIGSASLRRWAGNSANRQVLQKLGVRQSFIDSLQNSIKDGDPIMISGAYDSGRPAIVQYGIYNPDSPDPERQLLQADRAFPLAIDGQVVTLPLKGVPLASAQPVRLHYRLDRLFAAVQPLQETGNSTQVTLHYTDAQGGEQQQAISSGHTLTPEQLASGNLHLRWSLQMSDSLYTDRNRVPSLAFWQLYYQPAPEGVLYETPASVQRAQPLYQEAEPIDKEFIFRNLSPTAYADSVLLVKSYGGRDIYEKLPALKGGQAHRFGWRIDTKEPNGIPLSEREVARAILLQANPASISALPDYRRQQETDWENNGYQQVVRIARDASQPAMDITFDGRRILNKELVAPNPMVNLLLDDENKFITQLSPEHLRLEIARADGGYQLSLTNLSEHPVEVLSTDKRLELRFPLATLVREHIAALPASLQQEYRQQYLGDTEMLQDGEYLLRIEGEDPTGNTVTQPNQPYAVSFKVVTRSAVTQVYPYPNPFSDKVRFVFTLTGSVVPDRMKIQIMTVTGRIVREILQDEIGPLRIGDNITQYAWDGRDEFGDQLANGLYLYRVFFESSSGQTYERLETKGDKLFKQQIGKLYLLR